MDREAALLRYKAMLKAPNPPPPPAPSYPGGAAAVIPAPPSSATRVVVSPPPVPDPSYPGGAAAVTAPPTSQLSASPPPAPAPSYPGAADAVASASTSSIPAVNPPTPTYLAWPAGNTTHAAVGEKALHARSVANTPPARAEPRAQSRRAAQITQAMHAARAPPLQQARAQTANMTSDSELKMNFKRPIAATHHALHLQATSRAAVRDRVRKARVNAQAFRAADAKRALLQVHKQMAALEDKEEAARSAMLRAAAAQNYTAAHEAKVLLLRAHEQMAQLRARAEVLGQLKFSMASQVPLSAPQQLSRSHTTTQTPLRSHSCPHSRSLPAQISGTGPDVMQVARRQLAVRTAAKLAASVAAAAAAAAARTIHRLAGETERLVDALCIIHGVTRSAPVTPAVASDGAANSSSSNGVGTPHIESQAIPTPAQNLGVDFHAKSKDPFTASMVTPTPLHLHAKRCMARLEAGRILQLHNAKSIVARPTSTRVLTLGAVIVAIAKDDRELLGALLDSRTDGAGDELALVRVMRHGTVGLHLRFGDGEHVGTGKASRKGFRLHHQQLSSFELGDTALHLAARNAKPRCAQLLLGLHDFAQRPPYNGAGRTPADVARGHECRALFGLEAPNDKADSYEGGPKKQKSRDEKADSYEGGQTKQKSRDGYNVKSKLDPGIWAVCRLQAQVRGWSQRYNGITYTKVFRKGKIGFRFEKSIVTKVIANEQAARLGVAVGSVLLHVNGKRRLNDNELTLLLATVPRPMRVCFLKPGIRAMHVREELAAVRLQAVFRGKRLRERGVDYDVVFHKGALGFRVVALRVVQLESGGQAEIAGISVGARVLAVGGNALRDDDHLMAEITAVPRPLTVRFRKEPAPDNRSGELFLLREDNTWKPKRVSIDTDGQLTFASTKKRNKVQRLDFRSAAMEVVMTDAAFRDKHRQSFSFVENSFVIRSQSWANNARSNASGTPTAAALHFAAPSLDVMAEWIIVLSAALKAKPKPV